MKANCRLIRHLILLSFCLGASVIPLTAEIELDAFGGWTGQPFEATGYFRLEQGEAAGGWSLRRATHFDQRAGPCQSAGHQLALQPGILGTRS